MNEKKKKNVCLANKNFRKYFGLGADWLFINVGLSVGQSVHQFGLKHLFKFGTHIYFPPGMNCNNAGDPLNFYQVPSGQIF